MWTLYLFMDGIALLLLGYACGRVRPLKKLGLRLKFEKDES